MKIKLILLIPLFILMTGCWDYHELNKIAIVTGISIDKDGDTLEVSILISNAKKSSSINSDESSTITYVGYGNNMTDAFKNIASICPKKLYLGHLSAVIISDELAYDGVNIVTDYLLRESEIVKSFYLILSKDSSAKDVLNSLSPLEAFPTQTIYKKITTSSEAQGFSLAVSFNDFISNMIKIGKNAILPSVTIVKDDENKVLKIDKIGIFKNDKLIGYASEKASRGISILENSVNQLSTTVSCDNGNLSFNVNSLKSTKKVKDDNLIINISGASYLKEVNCKLDLNDINVIKKIESSIEKDLKDAILKAIEETKDYQSDIFGFGNMLYKSNNNYFKRIKNRWNNEIYPNLNTKVDVDIKLISNGSIKKTIEEVIDER